MSIFFKTQSTLVFEIILSKSLQAMLNHYSGITITKKAACKHLQAAFDSFKHALIQWVFQYDGFFTVWAGGDDGDFRTTNFFQTAQIRFGIGW